MATLRNQQVKELFAKARKAQVKGRLDEAERGYKRLLKAAPQLAEVQFNLAEILVLRGRMAEASALFEEALKLRPKEPAIWISYLNMASKHPNPKNFDILRRRAKPVLAKSAAFAFFEGLAVQRDGDWTHAAALYKAAIAGGYKPLQLYIEYGAVLVELKQFDHAMEQLDHALALSPKNDRVWFDKVSLLQSMGRIDEAREAVRKAIEISPKASSHYSLYASLNKMASDDPFVPKMKSALKSKRVGDPELASLAFSLAKAMEDSGELGKVFGYLKQANDALSKSYPYDAAATTATVDSIRKIYEDFKDMDVPVSDLAPIFVTGAPRSGTTLIEQILASHSSVEGGGELGLLQPKVTDALTDQGDDFVAQSAQAVSAFEADLAKIYPDAGHVTDKSISTYVILGFLAKLMPKARFIVVRRDPRDNALSIYKNQFRGGLHRYSNRLDHIAVFLRQFEDMVGFWRAQCPDRFYEIKYEDLIADPEAQSRALVAAAGLQWEDACLSFYETNREVKTLSATQVRQPMYSSSVGAWKKFEADMQPFLKAYDDLAISDIK